MNEPEMNLAESRMMEFCAYQPVYNGSSESEINYDYALPDYIPDIRRIMHTAARVKNLNWYPNGNRISYEGEVGYTVLFSGEEGKLSSASFSIPYTGELETGVLPEDCAITVKPYPENISLRLLNPRKLNARGRVRCEVSVANEHCISPAINGEHTIDDEADLESDTVELQGVRMLHYPEQETAVSEDIEIDASSQPIEEILSCTVNMAVPEARSSMQHLQITLIAYVQCIYRGDDGKIITLQRKFPLNAVLDAPGAADGCACFAYARPGEVKATAQPNAYGENKIIELDYSYTLGADCAVNAPTAVTRDMYAISHEYDTHYTERQLYRLCGAPHGNFTVNESITRQAAGADTVKEVLCADVSLRTPTVVSDVNRGKIIFDGNADLSIIATDGSEYLPIKFTIPYHYETDCRNIGEKILCTSDLVPCNLHVRLDAGNVSVDFEVMVGAMILSQTNVRMVESITFDASKGTGERRRAPIILYYPKHGESLWNIAKRYQTTRAAIASTNHISGDIITGEKVIIVPRAHARVGYTGMIE